MATTRWQFFVDWLGFGISGIHPSTLWHTLGPVSILLPIAQQAAAALGPWLVSLLDERGRRGLDLGHPLLVRRLGREEAEQVLLAATERVCGQVAG